MMKKKLLTESNKIFEALKSRYMTGFSASWRKARPFAAPSAIFIRVDHGSDTEYPATSTRQYFCEQVVLYFDIYSTIIIDFEVR